jgi:hypothetical protein
VNFRKPKLMRQRTLRRIEEQMDAFIHGVAVDDVTRDCRSAGQYSHSALPVPAAGDGEPPPSIAVRARSQPRPRHRTTCPISPPAPY